MRFGFGAGVDPKLHAGFEERFGFPLVEAWAMTETGAGAVICANQLPRRVGESCLGKPGPELDVRIIDADGQASQNGPGELLVRRKGSDPRRGFFSGYFKNAEATQEAWAEGWFHTGDIVRREADGSMFFVDRKKNVIRRSGENIAAVEVESALMRHPKVLAAAVAAVADPVRGDEVFACLKGGWRARRSARHRDRRLVPRPTRLLQGAGLCCLCRCAAADIDPENPAERAQGTGGQACAGSGKPWTLAR